MKNILRVSALFIGSLMLAGCKTSEAFNSHPNVVVYGSHIQIERVSDHALEGGIKQAVVTGKSTARHDRPIRYRALWSDSEGRPIKTVVSTWGEMTLAGRRPFNMEFVAPGNRARAYQVEIEVLEEN